MPMTEAFISFSYFKSVQSKSFAIRKTIKPIRENPAIRAKSGPQATRQSTDCMQDQAVAKAAFVTTALRPNPSPYPRRGLGRGFTQRTPPI